MGGYLEEEAFFASALLLNKESYYNSWYSVIRGNMIVDDTLGRENTTVVRQQDITLLLCKKTAHVRPSNFP